VVRTGDRKVTYKVYVRKTEERDHLEDIGVDGRMILKLIFKQWDWGMHSIDLPQYRGRCWALVRAAMNTSSFVKSG
jgi:hypothetical protein